jgi:hypothetical protein
MLSPNDMVGCGPRGEREVHEAMGVHHAARRHVRRVAARGARTAAQPDAAHWRACIDSNQRAARDATAFKRHQRRMDFLIYINVIEAVRCL